MSCLLWRPVASRQTARFDQTHYSKKVEFQQSINRLFPINVIFQCLRSAAGRKPDRQPATAPAKQVIVQGWPGRRAQELSRGLAAENVGYSAPPYPLVSLLPARGQAPAVIYLFAMLLSSPLLAALLNPPAGRQQGSIRLSAHSWHRAIIQGILSGNSCLLFVSQHPPAGCTSGVVT